jgi:23S rRNA-/tRNA-specific pseudouridylate synthase
MISPVWREGQLAGFDKPESIHSTGTAPDTLQSRISEYWACAGIPIPLQPEEAGLISRLDFLTSGLIFACSDSRLRMSLMESDSHSGMEKFYLAVCSEQTVEPCTALVKTQTDHWTSAESAFRAFGPGRKLVKACPASGRGSKNSSARIYKTDFLELARKDSAVLFLCRISNGFRHQIRVHLSSCGFPIEGDPLYNSRPQGRLRLHSYGARFCLPGQTKIHEVVCPPPELFVPFLDEDTFFLTLEKSRSLMSTW